jgi:hypothetical protein
MCKASIHINLLFINNTRESLHTHTHTRTHTHTQGSTLEMHLAQYFVEDRAPTLHSYADFMMVVHKAVQSK